MTARPGTLAADLIEAFRRHGVEDAENILRLQADALEATVTIYDSDGADDGDDFPTRTVTLSLHHRED